MRLIVLFSIVCVPFISFGQCVVTTTINWVNTTTPACQSDNILQIGASGNVTFDNNTDVYGTEDVSIIYVSGVLTLTGDGPIRANIVVQNGGRVNVNSNFDLFGSVTINSGGIIEINDQLNLVASGTCNRNFTIQPGGQLIMNSGGSSDRLNICGNRIFQSGTAGSCNAFPNGGPTYCSGNAPFSGGAIVPQNGNPLVLIPTGVLPVKLLYFTASLSDGIVSLNWATGKEENFDHFEIERASNGQKFLLLDSVRGAGYNTSSIQRYELLDENPLIGDNYYRLKAVDLNGSFEYFNVVSATVLGHEEFSVYPNPSDGGNISYRINFDFEPRDRIILLNSMGNELQRNRVSKFEGEFQFDEQLKPGIYLLQYTSDRFTKTVRLTIR
jgi:hypothetical protein